MNSLNLLKDNKSALSYFYLLLAILGAILTMLSNYHFALDYGLTFDVKKFVELANANPAAESISRDLIISASAIFIWIINESKKLNIKNMWVIYLGTFLIAFFRERRLIEMEKMNL